jgi:hypothetical protein
MATQITKFADIAGTVFNTEAEADASSAAIQHKEIVDAFVSRHFPLTPSKKEGGKARNPHANTARKAIFMWISQNGSPVSLEA